MSIATSVIDWVISTASKAKEWVSPDGRQCSQATLDGASTAYDMWPTSGTKPTQWSIAELTLHRTLWSDPTMERMNVSAMVDAEDGGAYRIGVERGNGGQFRPILFCFEDVTPGVSLKALKIEPDGSVYVYDSTSPDGWRKL